MYILKRLLILIPSLVLIIPMALLEVSMDIIKFRPYAMEWISGHVEHVVDRMYNWAGL